MHQTGRSVLLRSEPDRGVYIPYDARDDSGGRGLALSPAVLRRTDIDARTWAIKRAMDILIASTGLVILAPVLAVVAIAILLDSPGPVLFRQTRIGKYGQPFVMLKFRTMRPERRTQTWGAPSGITERRRVHKSPRDPRITRVGRFLRRSCLDEVPQLWHVLRGDMSPVGPRPALPEIVAICAPWQQRPHAVAPGIRGWW